MCKYIYIDLHIFINIYRKRDREMKNKAKLTKK